jgi:hypothetical protein
MKEHNNLKGGLICVKTYVVSDGKTTRKLNYNGTHTYVLQPLLLLFSRSHQGLIPYISIKPVETLTGNCRSNKQHY